LPQLPTRGERGPLRCSSPECWASSVAHVHRRRRHEIQRAIHSELNRTVVLRPETWEVHLN